MSTCLPRCRSDQLSVQAPVPGQADHEGQPRAQLAQACMASSGKTPFTQCLTDNLLHHSHFLLSTSLHVTVALWQLCACVTRKLLLADTFYLVQDARAAKAFLSQAHSYLQSRLSSLNNHCVVCDDSLQLPGAKPVPCSRPTCGFAHDELGVGAGGPAAVLLHVLFGGTCALYHDAV